MLLFDCEPAYADNIDPGKATVTISGAGNYTGSIVRDFLIVDTKSLSHASFDVKAPSQYSYTGQAIAPKPRVFYVNGTELEEGKHFQYRYYRSEGGSGYKPVDANACVEAGPYGVKVVAVDGGGYTDDSEFFYYEIVKADPEDSVDIGDGRAEVAVPNAITGLVYNGNVQTGVASGAGFTVSGGSAVDAGSYKATVTPDSNHKWPDGSTGAKEISWSIAKAENPLKVASKKLKAIKESNLKNKAQVIKRGKAIAVSDAQGTVSYKLAGVKKAKFKKYFSVNSKNGNITVKKKLKRGSYLVTVTVTDPGSRNYEAASGNATVTVKVK